MEGCPAGDAGTVLNTVGGRNAQGFDYAILPPSFEDRRWDRVPCMLVPYS